jgi:two-component system, NtrC family, sensor histidine kinase HydH
MTAFVYFLVATIAVVLATRAWMGERADPAKIAFLGLGWALALTWTLFALSLFPGLGVLRLPYMAIGGMVPGLALFSIDRLFGDRKAPPGPVASRLLLLSVAVSPTCVAVQAMVYQGTPGSSPAQLALAAFTFTIAGVVLLRLWQVHESTPLRVEKYRLRYLIGVTAGAVAFGLAEQVGRALASTDPTVGLSYIARAVALQGPLPPLSVLLTGIALYFLYHSVVNYRLLDLYELFSYAAALVVSALVLVTINGIAVLWVDTFNEYPLHTAFQTFVASILFLIAYDPLKSQIDWWSNRLLNRRGHQLSEALDALRSEVPQATSKELLTEMLLRRLHGSGRVPLCSVYLWDETRDAYALAGIRGEVDPEPLAAVAGPPFTDGFTEEGRAWYVRADVARRSRHDDPVATEILQMMVAMHADLTIAFRSGDLVLGWMHLQDEDWSDGFSADEVGRLAEVAGLAAVALSNIAEFRRLEDAHRLAALGAMAAGLAHEIRNPLAGIKGAAQYLKAERLEDDAKDMLDVVIHEVDRLNVVVSQFLEYARPFDLQRAPDHVNAIASHILQVLRAQGVPTNVQVIEDLAPELPALAVDRGRIAQVVLNLCQNALQAMPNGGTLTVRTRKRPARHGGEVLELAVADTGTGITAEALDQLFVPFFTTKETGTGLGLAISQRIIQAHGGEIEVQNRPGRGATFIVTLPSPDPVDLAVSA